MNLYESIKAGLKESSDIDLASIIQEIKQTYISECKASDMRWGANTQREYHEPYWDFDETLDNLLVIDIEWGDWKHDHDFCDSLVKKVASRHGLDVHIDTDVYEEDGSDCYSANHICKFSGKYKDSESPKNLTEGKKEVEYDYTKRKYGDNGYYTKSLTELCEHGTISWERLVRKLIDYFPGEAIKVFCIAYQYTQAIHNPTGDYYDKYYSEALIELCEDGEVEWSDLAKGLLDFFTEDELKAFYIEQHFPDATSEDSESSKEDLKESPETTNYPDWIIAELSEGNDVQAWYCPDCDTFFKEPKYVSTDMENYYGVGSDFSDHHYQDIPVCPNCDKDNLEEVYISFDSLVDDFLSNEDNYQKVYEEISNRHPEYIKSSDTLLEDIPEDVLIPVVKELMF